MLETSLCEQLSGRAVSHWPVWSPVCTPLHSNPSVTVIGSVAEFGEGFYTDRHLYLMFSGEHWPREHRADERSSTLTTSPGMKI